MRSERFPDKCTSKLHPRGDRPFQVLEFINDNAYKIDLPGEYNPNNSFPKLVSSDDDEESALGKIFSNEDDLKFGFKQIDDVSTHEEVEQNDAPKNSFEVAMNLP
ncbi:hypothetical protein FNV43_RR07361 [Rhamnella rubrinervis]|uniref:Tf2-1-like SH3-like domain-containing protein n=1 Tax=Rhamnella rubrinervis TaxID=2594499 RepID=A0A8K0MM44_9ROSA|nr:hypothetical protein FNV43_RR07361 [Rhamnella rubrinervis]